MIFASNFCNLLISRDTSREASFPRTQQQGMGTKKLNQEFRNHGRRENYALNYYATAADKLRYNSTSVGLVTDRIMRAGFAFRKNGRPGTDCLETIGPHAGNERNGEFSVFQIRYDLVES